MSNVDVRLPHVSFEILEGQDVVDFAFVFADGRAEPAGSGCGDDCRRLLEPVEEFPESPTPLVRERKAGSGDHEDRGCHDREPLHLSPRSFK